MVLFVNRTNAQDSKFSILPTIGFTAPILDSGIGLHFGLNPHFKLTGGLSAEGQISYIHTRISSSFLSGKSGSINAVNILAGGRYYLTSDTKKTRFFVNLLAGLNYTKENVNGIDFDPEYNFGFSAGVFMELDNIALGVATETPEFLVFKLGYSF